MYKKLLISVIKQYFVYLKKEQGSNLGEKLPSHNLS